LGECCFQIDVEGDELSVLEGIDDASFDSIKQIVLEVHDIHGRLQRILDLLKKKAFCITVEPQQPECHQGFLLYVPPEMAMFYVYAIRHDPGVVGACPRPTDTPMGSRARPAAAGKGTGPFPDARAQAHRLQY